MNRTLLRRPVCYSCRHELLRSFMYIAGVSMPRNVYAFPFPPSYTARTFSESCLRRSDQPPTSHHPGISLPSAEESPETKSNAPRSQHIPWYLQEEAPTTKTRELSEDHIPPIPENSPEILPVLLEYAYKDLGLDDLKLLDLRDLEVPVALGANVMMVIGTARSVKHLNVSADRLCRWLRSKYKLTPYADGLLGRNELKIKLRRKAKRARAASKAGGMQDEKDDGITTGWICVNAGMVDGGSAKAQLSDIGFEGFGEVNTGTSVVVQIFTEEKRADVDLEGLWQDTLDREERKRFREGIGASTQTDCKVMSRSSGGVANSGQKRSFHTTRRLATGDVNASQPSLSSALSEVVTPPPSPSHASVASESRWSPATLLKILADLPAVSAQSELGSGPDDRKSTLFLQLFYANKPSESSPFETSMNRLRLFSIAVSRQHPAYTKEALFSAFSDFLREGYDLPDELGFEVVSALLTPRADPAGDYTTHGLGTDVELALRTLDRLGLRGVPILNMRVLDMLYRAVGPPSIELTPSPDAEGETKTVVRNESQRQALSRLSQIAAAADLPFEADHARRLMVTMFQYEDFDGFWRLWRRIPLSGCNRMQDDYVRLFQLHAALGDERRARDCVSMWVPQMAHESPQIVLHGPIVTAIMHCLLLADSGIANQSTATPSYFAPLWSECQEALAKEE